MRKQQFFSQAWIKIIIFVIYHFFSLEFEHLLVIPFKE